MNTLAIDLSIAGTVAGIAALTWWLSRDTPAGPVGQQQIERDSVRRPGAPDNQPGQRADWQDQCELLWDMPARHPGLDRLRQAIRDEQQKGEQA
jgi:hypothetical protein